MSAARWCGPTIARTSRDRNSSRTSSHGSSVSVSSSWTSRNPRCSRSTPAPVVGQLVAGDADQPRDAQLRGVGFPKGRDRGLERFCGQVFGEYPIAATRHEIAVDLRQRVVVEIEQPQSCVGVEGRAAHVHYIARERRTPTPSRTRFQCWSTILPSCSPASSRASASGYSPSGKTRSMRTGNPLRPSVADISFVTSANSW